MSRPERLDLDDAFNERFQLLRLLGRGGMGSVYLAKERSLNREVAIKFLHLSLSEHDELAQKRFLEEGRIAAALKHPNIVQVFDSGLSGKHLYLVYEYIEGQSLQDIIDETEQPLKTDFVLRVGIAVADALTAAHELGITHRDIKPDNFMRTKEGELKLSDFGLSFKIGEEEKDEK